MTIRLTKETRDRVRADNRLDLREARELVDATGASLSNGEAKVLGELYDSFTRERPGTSAHPYATAGARDHLDELFERLDLPFGKNRADVMEHVGAWFAAQDLGAPLSRAPRTGSLVSLTLRDDRAVDGTRDTTFVNVVTKKAYLRIDGGGRGAPAAQWFGPFDLREPPTPPTPAVPAVPPSPATSDPLTDGVLTNPARVRQQYYRMAFDELLSWHVGAPPASVKLARGDRVSDVSPYFVVPEKPDGTADDPDKATHIYFRHLPSGKWSGPHAIT